MSVDLQAEVQSLKAEFEEFKKDSEAHQRLAAKLERHVEDFKNSSSSRRGLPGVSIKGEKGDKGDRGTDAVVKIVQSDGKIKVLNNDAVVAEILAVPGPEGKSIVGPSGKDSTVPGPRGESGISPSVKEIAAEVVKELGKIISKA